MRYLLSFTVIFSICSGMLNGQAELLIKEDTIQIDGTLLDSQGNPADGQQILSTDTLGKPIWIDKGIDAIKYFNNYDELRTFDVESSDSVAVVSDFTYQFNSITYTTVGGIFYYNSCVENGSTCIGGWQRVFDGVVHIPEWFEVGGRDVTGGEYINHLLSSSGIYNECDRVRNTSILAGVGGNILLKGSKVYEMDIEVNTLKDQYWHGSNPIFKRQDTPNSLLTQSISVGSNTVTVDDVSGFRVGQVIGVLDLSAPNNGLGHNENDQNGAHMITNISGNTMTVTNTFCCDFNVGDRVIRTGALFGNNSGANYGNLTFEGLIFDGNKANNPYTVDWRYSTNLSLGTGDNARFYKCTFRNTPSENMFIGNGTLFDCHGHNLNGSFIHTSENNVEKTGFSIKVIDCTTDSTNLGGLIMSHSEAVITFSNLHHNIRIEGCHFKNGMGQCFGPANSSSNANRSFSCHKTIFENFNSPSGFAFAFGAATTASKWRNSEVTECKFDNCGDVRIKGNSLQKGFTESEFTIKDCEFINSRIFVSSASKVDIINNKMVIDRSNGFDWVSNPGQGGAYIQVLTGDRINIISNELTGDSLYNANCQSGILVWSDLAGFRKDANGNNSKFYYSQNIKIKGNTIENFKFGISTDNTHAGTYFGNTVGWEIRDNKIHMINDSNYNGIAVGIQVPPATIASRNIIYVYDSTNTSYYPALVQGVESSESSELIGGIFIDNIIIGKGFRGIAVGNWQGGGAKYNCIVTRNICSQAINDFSGGNSYVQGNDILDTSMLPNLTNPLLPLLGQFEQYKSSY